MIKLAQYSLVELIQDSGTTCIYMGERTTDGAQVTVKLCKAEYPSTRDVLRLRHEYSILKELGEQGLRGIPRAYALENHGAGLILVMERLPGRPLHQVMQSGELELKTVLHIGSAIAGLLDALHRQRVIHKDIKPPEEPTQRARGASVPRRRQALGAHRPRCGMTAGAGACPGRVGDRRSRSQLNARPSQSRPSSRTRALSRTWCRKRARCA